jgi:hypothetical protein
MLFSLVYLLVRCLLGMLVTVARVDVAKEVELLVLRHENAVLRRQVPRPRYEPADRLWFAALSRLVPRRRWAMVFPVTPATILRWHRCLVARKWNYSDRRRPGRPPTAGAIKKLILAMARDNPGWGHVRHEAPRCIPNTVGRNLEGGSWVQWLTWIRKVKGTIACQESSGRVQAYEARCCGTRMIRRKLDCLNPNLQTMQQPIRRKDARNRRHTLCRHRYPADATSGVWSDSQ